jgi:hypothetical protein
MRHELEPVRSVVLSKYISVNTCGPAKAVHLTTGFDATRRKDRLYRRHTDFCRPETLAMAVTELYRVVDVDFRCYKARIRRFAMEMVER